MKRYQYSIYKKDTGDAGGKAKNDVYEILLQNGFEPSYVPSKFKIIRVIQQYLSLSKINKADVLVIQYPAVHPKLLQQIKTKCLDIKNRIAIIHDIRSIQGLENSIKDEISFFKYFNQIIVHNQAMEDYVIANGYDGKTIKLEVFDYLHDLNRKIDENEYSGTICIAGNLDKARYLSNLDRIEKYQFNLFGKNNFQNFAGKQNIHYCGLLPSDEIVYELKGDYGLVWDGDSIETCEGKFGNYLLYNSPHKLSLYIASGKPIITWSKAAVADFVKNNEIGIVLNSLTELDSIDLKINYKKYKSNVKKIKKMVGEGYFLNSALKKVQ